MPGVNQEITRPFSKLEFFARQTVEGFITGLHKSPFHGFSVEFAEHRLYNTGESTRHIDWKLYGRSDKLFVKRYEEETNLRCQIVIDCSKSMHFPLDSGRKEEKKNKISFAAYCAAALTELLRRQRDATGLSVFSEKLHLHTPAKSGSPHLKMIFHELDKLADAPPPKAGSDTTTLVETLHIIAEAINKRSLVVIFSDMFESHHDMNEIFSALQHLRHKKHEVILFHVTDKKMEQDFEFESRPMRFIDLESGEEIKVNPGDIRNDYAAAMEKFRKNLKVHAAGFRIDWIDADINTGLNQVLMPFLVKRIKMS
jgi:uncharacterized protein (DUF58 family)